MALLYVHCHEGHAQSFLNRWSPNLTLCWCRARGSSLCTTTWSISSLGKGRPQPPQATRRRKRPNRKKYIKENQQEVSKRRKTMIYICIGCGTLQIPDFLIGFFAWKFGLVGELFFFCECWVGGVPLRPYNYSFMYSTVHCYIYPDCIMYIVPFILALFLVNKKPKLKLVHFSFLEPTSIIPFFNKTTHFYFYEEK